MFNNSDEVLRYISDGRSSIVDVRFCDLPGVMQHFTVPASVGRQDFFTDGWRSTARRSAASRRSTSRT